MEHDRTDQEDKQRAIVNQRAPVRRFAVFAAWLRAPRPLVIDLTGADKKQGQEGRECADHNEEKDAAIGDEIAEQAH